MQRSNIRDAKKWFDVLETASKSQVAVMKLLPGKASGPRGNEHPKSEQILLVVEGEIFAEIGKEKATLRKGDIVIVPTDTDHRFTNLSESDALTFNVYAPPAY